MIRSKCRNGSQALFWAFWPMSALPPIATVRRLRKNRARPRQTRAGRMYEAPFGPLRAGPHLMNAAIFRFVPTTLPVSATDEPARDSRTNRSFQLCHGALLATKLHRLKCTALVKKCRDRRHTLSPLGREVSRPLPTCRSGLPIVHHSKPLAKNVAMGQKRTLRSLRPMSAYPQ